tara:strand:- start:10678 stop:11079 length:402 start_codon:yes stop_codon:yes gene_type:complete
MPFEKGESGNLAGRPKGSQNRSTKAMKKSLAQLIDDNLDNMSDWLNEMATDDPKAAFQCMLSLMEFHMPKMSRVTWVGEKEPENKTCNSAAKEIADSVHRSLEQVISEAEQREFSGVSEKHEFIDNRLDEFSD